MDLYSGHLYIAGDEMICPNPIKEKGWIYPTESSLPVAGAFSEFQQTLYRSMQVSNFKETPDAESTQVPMVTLTAKRIKKKLILDSVVRSPLEIKPAQEREKEQWQFIRDEAEKMKKA